MVYTNISEMNSLDTAYIIYKLYENILNSYVSDYYIEEHWKKLPKSWQENFKNLSIVQLSELLDFSKPSNGRVYPLSLLCLRRLIIHISIPRTQLLTPAIENNIFERYFWKNVKMKKRHEINIMAQICATLADQENCSYIVDIGSGLGHLSRMLCYRYGLRVLTFEADSTLSILAKQMDMNFEETINRKNIVHKKISNTVHMCKRITSDLSAEEFLQLVRSAFDKNDNNFTFGMIGLHPCGGLGSTLLKLYSNCPNVAFIAMASCCYMKMNLNNFPSSDFPLSNYCRVNNYQLSYLSCEIACHAIEKFFAKLKNADENCEFKIHAYRAALEKVLVFVNPKFKHSMVCNVKYNENLTLKEYFLRTLQKYNLNISDDIIKLNENIVNQTWEKVVIFYSIRLILAPLVETIILLDRKLYIEESNSACQLLAAFDCNISPRNQVIFAQKCCNS